MPELVGILGVIATAGILLGTALNYLKHGKKPTMFYIAFMALSMGNAINSIVGSL